MQFQFIHSSDLHLGEKFANIPEIEDNPLRGRLVEARHKSIGVLAAKARQTDAKHILLAGDTFDSASPSTSVVRQAMTAMRDDPGLTWWIIPGNHDNLKNAEPLWESFENDKPDNVRLLRENCPVEVEANVFLLPAPVTHRKPGEDLTGWMTDASTPEGALRIGLAHGGVVDFQETEATIPPNRDTSAGLDYLALGDWHRRIKIGERVHYSGAPEPDGFKHNTAGVCLSVTLNGRSEPEVAEMETGNFNWLKRDLTLLEGAEPAVALKNCLPVTNHRNTLIRLSVSGIATLEQEAKLVGECNKIAPEFALFDTDFSDLESMIMDSELEEIDYSGALRLALEELRSEAENPDIASEQRDIAMSAIKRLYHYMKDAAP